MRKSVTSKYVECYCGKKYQYRKSYTKHTQQCKIFQIEIEKPLQLGDYPLLTAECMKALNEEAKSILELVH